MQGLLGGLGGFVDSIEGLVGQILGPLQTMFAEIKNLLTSLKDKLISFIDRLVDQIKAVFDTLKKTVQTLINQLVSAITNMLTSFIAGIANAILGPVIKALVEPLIQSIASGLLSQYIAQIIQEMITNFIKEIIDKFIQEIIGKFVQNIFAGIDALLNKILEPINKIKEAINKWHQEIMDFIEKGMRQLLGPIHNVLSIVKGDILKLPGTGGGLNIGSSLTSAVSGFASGVLSKERKTVEEAVRKLNEMERKILGTLVRARDAATQLSSLIRIPVIGRGGQLQATLLGIGESAVSDDYGQLGTIAFPHDPQKKIAGWYDEYTLILHTAGLTMSIPADYSLVAPFIEDLRALLGAAPPSVLWVKVNEVGPVLRGDTIDIAILGDPNRPSVPGGRESSRVYVTLPDGSITQLSLDSLPTIRPIEQPPSSTTLIGPFFPFPLDGPLLSPFFPFPFPGRPPPVAFSVSVFEEPVEDPSATSVPRVLVPADTATGTVLLAPFFPFPMNKPPAA
jgi:predicted PurR-regulated permease PerM